MYPIVYEYNLNMNDYKEMSFFATFSFRRWQRIFLFVSWIAATASYLLNLAGVIVLEQTVRLCTLLVAVTLPMLFINTLLSIQRFKTKGKNFRKKKHTVLLGKDEVQYRESGNPNTGSDKWDDILYAYETKNLFLLYRTPKTAVMLPKRSTTDRQIEETRTCLKEKLGPRYKIRCKVNA